MTNHDVNHVLYPEGSNETVASGFGNFFQEKIHKIKYEIETIKQNDLISETCDDHTLKVNSQFSKFKPLSLDEILSLINSSTNSSCSWPNTYTTFKEM